MYHKLKNIFLKAICTLACLCAISRLLCNTGILCTSACNRANSDLRCSSASGVWLCRASSSSNCFRSPLFSSSSNDARSLQLASLQQPYSQQILTLGVFRTLTSCCRPSTVCRNRLISSSWPTIIRKSCERNSSSSEHAMAHECRRPKAHMRAPVGSQSC